MNPLTERYLDFDQQTGASARYLARLRQDEMLMIAFSGSFLPRPTFLETADQQQLAADLRAMFDLLVSLPARLTGGDLAQFCRLLGLSDPQISAVLRTQDGPPVSVGRVDLYQDQQGFKLLEFNLGSALGGLENPHFNRAALQDEELAGFLLENRLAFTDTMSALADTVRTILADSNADPDPLVALVDVPQNYVQYPERLRNMADRFCEYGMRTISCHTGELVERQGRLYHGDQQVDVVYRYFLMEDLLADAEQVEHILRAQERGRVRIFASLETEILSSKRALALLSDPAVLADLSADERRLVDRVLPWTRSLVPGPTSTPEGTADLLEYARAHRDDLILKATLLHGGQQITPGWLVPDAEWRDLLAGALGSGFVIQQRVRPLVETFSTGGESTSRVLNWGVYLTAGGYGGGILRGSADPDVGVVSIGGGAQVGGLFHQLPPAAG